MLTESPTTHDTLVGLESTLRLRELRLTEPEEVSKQRAKETRRVLLYLRDQGL